MLVSILSHEQIAGVCGRWRKRDDSCESRKGLSCFARVKRPEAQGMEYREGGITSTMNTIYDTRLTSLPSSLGLLLL